MSEIPQVRSRTLPQNQYKIPAGYLHSSVGPNFVHEEVVSQICHAMARIPNETREAFQRRCAFSIKMYNDLDPKDPIEVLLAIEIVVNHALFIAMTHRAVRALDGSHVEAEALKSADRCQKRLLEFSNKLDKRRGQPQQRVTVEHVNVEKGGQAIVGNVSTSSAESARVRTRSRPS